MVITRGTTPTLTFTLPFEADAAAKCSVAFSQKKAPYTEASVVIEKTLKDLQIAGNVLTVTLSEADSLKFDSKAPVEIQVRIKLGDTALASNIITESVGRILKDGCL